MNEQKHNTFKKAALSHIPNNILASMEKQTAIREDDFKKLQEKILEHGPTLHAQTFENKQDIANPKFMSYVINDHVVQVPLNDEIGAAVTLFYTLLAFVWGKDKQIAKILKQFNFKFFDINQVQVYPPLKKDVKKRN